MSHSVNFTKVPVEGEHVLVAAADLLIGALAGQLVLVVRCVRLTLFLGERWLVNEHPIWIIRLNLNRRLFLFSIIEGCHI